MRGASGEAMRNKSRPLSPLICIILLYRLLHVALRNERTTACGLTCMTTKPSPSLNVQSSLDSPFSRKFVLHHFLGRPLDIFSLKGFSHIWQRNMQLCSLHIFQILRLSWINWKSLKFTAKYVIIWPPPTHTYIHFKWDSTLTPFVTQTFKITNTMKQWKF